MELIKENNTLLKVNHHTKELVKRIRAVGLKKGELKEFADIRFYMSRGANASKVYCDCWINCSDKNVWLSSNGAASGYGYNRIAASAYNALHQLFKIELELSDEERIYQFLENVGTELFEYEKTIILR